MKNLWAPWRMTYIQEDVATEKDGKRTKPCVFCTLPQEDNDRENLILQREKKVFVILNRFPYSNGHLMIVPYEHTGDLTTLAADAHDEMFRVGTRFSAILKKVVNAQGLNMGINLGRCAGAGIADHVHLHLVPRWSGDTNFIPVLGEAKVISEHLHATYDKLASHL